MKQNILLTLLLVLSFNLDAQDSKFSIEANYPTPIDDNFVGEAVGIIDLGLKYKFATIDFVSVGASFNAGVLIDNSNQNEGALDFLRTIFVIQPKVFVELNIQNLEKLRPFVGVGYTFLNFKISGTLNSEDVSGRTENLNGFGLNLGLAYDISNKVFVQIQYDFTKVSVDNDVPDIPFNTNVNLLKVGVGLKL
ncbi:outer membrane protein [Winogradskyella poriferorum]|uniref:outer membrane protein n=1 Tax=Winogradskyella poriferorum TaxID=307627 RepID=UPI003D65DFAC